MVRDDIGLYDMICVYVGSLYLGVVVLASWQFVRLLFEGCSERPHQYLNNRWPWVSEAMGLSA